MFKKVLEVQTSTIQNREQPIPNRYGGVEKFREACKTILPNVLSNGLHGAVMQSTKIEKLTT